MAAGIVPNCMSAYTFDSLPLELKQPVKELLLEVLGDRTLSGDEVVMGAQNGIWENLSELHLKARRFWKRLASRNALGLVLPSTVVVCSIQIFLPSGWIRVRGRGRENLRFLPSHVLAAARGGVSAVLARNYCAPRAL